MSDLDDLRGFDDDFDDEPMDFGGEEIAIEDGTASRGGLFGMSPVEQVIIALFFLLNIIALVVIFLLATGAFG